MTQSSPRPRFDGDDFQEDRDHDRLTGQIKRIYDLMQDGVYRTLGQIAGATGDPEASISAQLRNLRKERFGGHHVKRRWVERGLYEYQLVIPKRPTAGGIYRPGKPQGMLFEGTKL